MRWSRYTLKRAEGFIELPWATDILGNLIVSAWVMIFGAWKRGFSILFNDADDDFLLEKNGGILTGISFVTDYRASLEDAPEQVIKFISIHDWSLR